MKNLFRILLVLAITLTYSCKKEKGPQPASPNGGSGNPTPTGTLLHKNVELTDMRHVSFFGAVKNGNIEVRVNNILKATVPYGLPNGFGIGSLVIGDIYSGDTLQLMWSVGLLSHGTSIPPYDTTAESGTLTNYNGLFFTRSNPDPTILIPQYFKQKIFEMTEPLDTYTADSIKYSIIF